MQLGQTKLDNRFKIHNRDSSDYRLPLIAINIWITFLLDTRNQVNFLVQNLELAFTQIGLSSTLNGCVEKKSYFSQNGKRCKKYVEICPSGTIC